ncbi:MAG TPA: hypothetical protein VHL59_06120 [Thermoanaerobaculia bacterium]|nr:hypothetical protein [Thermoanaerobaculia bacterium]
MRELLACYPHLADAVAIPFVEAGDALPEEIVTRQWNDFRARHMRRAPSPRIWQAAAALAATVALTFGGALWQTRRELAAPRLIEAEQILHSPLGRGGRGGADTILSANAGNVTLVVSLHDLPQFHGYRVDMLEVRGDDRRQRWSSTAATRSQDDALRILIPRQSLDPGDYEIVVSGLGGVGERSPELVRHSVRVEGD